MLSRHSKGLRPLSFLVLTLCLSQAAQAQVPPPSQVDAMASRDVGVWSDFARPSAPAASNKPTDDASFSAISRGGPWTAADWQPLSGPSQTLMAQARAGQWGAVLATLKAHNPDVDPRDRDGATLLTLAARQGQLDAVRELLRRGAEVDRRGLLGFTPLCAAAAAGHDLVVQELLRSGAEPERWSAQGQPPLHLAARAGHARVVRTLLAAGARPLAWNQAGRHALVEAALGGQTEAMDALVEAGVPATAPDRQGLNALHAAAMHRHVAAVEWLRQRGVPVPHPLTQVLLDAMTEGVQPTP
jgi:uncharacterized protein